MPTGSKMRWFIVALIFLASVLNYLDRQTLSILAPTIQSALNLTNRNYALVLNLFLAAYTLAYLFSGRLVDRLGVKLSFVVFVLWWSLSEIATGLARSMGGLGACRFALGLGEAGNWTAAPKAVAEWFPAHERALAVGIYTLGGTIGATIAPVVVIGLASRYSWQAAFVVTGLAGLLWILPWLWIHRRSATTIRPAAVETVRQTEAGAWRSILRWEVAALMLARLLTDPVWYFYQFWFAKYLHDSRQLDQRALTVTWVIFLAADLGAVGGGWLSGWLIKRNLTPASSRLWVMLASACLAPCSALLPHAGGLKLVLALGMVAALAHMAWLINLSSLVIDVLPPRSLATAFGVIAAGSAAGGILMNWGVGWLVADFSYTPVFSLAAGVYPLALALLWRLRKSTLSPQLSPA